MDVTKLARKPIKMLDVIDFLEGLKDFRVTNDLPFNTADYYYIDDMIEYLKTKVG